MWHARFFSPCRLVLAGFLSLLCLLALPAWAADRDELVDPPSRALRLNYLSGTASFAPADSDDWEAATINRPLTQGDRLWVEKGERAELHLGSTVIRLAGATGLEILELGDADLKLKLSQGSLSMRVRDYPDDENIEIDTPNLAFEIGNPGEYRFDVNPDRDTTTVSARRGAGLAYSDDDARPPVRVNTGQRLRFDGRDLFVLESASVGPRDEFDRWVAQRDDREDASQSARYVSREMTGYEDLDANGDWRDEPGYGAVWVPRVTISNWAPYRHGHWAWVVPWGWTWVDDAPWGFAPFHYGRWAHFGSHWGWVPGPIVRRPVYAPALVAFVGGRSGGVSISLSTGLPGVAWFALGPNEPYRPAYRHRPEYLGRVNPHITVNRTVNVYVNQRVPHAVAVMPERDFVRGAATRPGQITAHRDHDLTRQPVREGVSMAPVRERSRDAAAPTRNVPERAFRQSAVGQQRISQDRMRSPAERQSNAPGVRGERSRDSAAPRSGPERRENPSERLPAMRSEGPSSERQPVRESRPSEERRLPGNESMERRDGRRNEGPRAEDRSPPRVDPRQPDQQRQAQEAEQQRRGQEQRRQQEQGRQQEQQQQELQRQQRQQQEQRQQEQGRRQQQDQEQRRQQELQGQQRQQQEQEQQRRQQEQQAQQRQQEQQQAQQRQRQEQEQEQRQQEQGRRQQQEQEQRRQQELQGQQRQQQEQEQQRRQQEQQAQQRQRQEQDQQRQQEQQRRQQEAQQRESRQPEARQPERKREERRPDKRADEGGGRWERR